MRNNANQNQDLLKKKLVNNPKAEIRIAIKNASKQARQSLTLKNDSEDEDEKKNAKNALLFF
jgi:hypothetical protein